MCVSIDSEFTSSVFLLPFFLYVNLRLSFSYAWTMPCYLLQHPSIQTLVSYRLLSGHEQQVGKLWAMEPIYTYKLVSQELPCTAKLDSTEIKSL